MAASNIIEFLEKNKGRFFTTMEISKRIGVGHKSVYSCLRRDVSKRIGIVCTKVYSEEQNRINKHNIKVWVYAYIGGD